MRSIDAHSVGTKSRQTSRARHSEFLVIRHLEQTGFTNIQHDIICVGVQVDLLARDPRGILKIIEVKSQTLRGLGHLPRAQTLRLARVAHVLAQFEPVELELAFVDERGAVILLPVDKLTG